MRKGLVFVFLAVFIISLIPSPAYAIPVNRVRFFPCIAEDGTYKLTIQVEGYTKNGFNGDVASPAGVYIGNQVRVRINAGNWKYYSYGQAGLILKYGKIVEGTKFEVQEVYNGAPTGFSSPLSTAPGTHSITLMGKDYPACFKKCEGKPLFKMYVLTKDDSYCILVSDVHPSVESQKALCFPGTEWVATNTVCEGWVCDNDCWDCDYFGFSRFSLKDLWDIYKRRMGE